MSFARDYLLNQRQHPPPPSPLYWPARALARVCIRLLSLAPWIPLSNRDSLLQSVPLLKISSRSTYALVFTPLSIPPTSTRTASMAMTVPSSPSSASADSPNTPQTPVSPTDLVRTLSLPPSDQSSPSATNSLPSPLSSNQAKRKPSRRANTAERRATHNAVERQRRETLNGRFLVCCFASDFVFRNLTYYFLRILPLFSPTFLRSVALPSRRLSILPLLTFMPLAAIVLWLPVNSVSSSSKRMLFAAS